MPSFDDYFSTPQQEPIKFHNLSICRHDSFRLNGVHRILLVFESSQSKWRQGIRLKTDGKFRVNNSLIGGRDGFVLWKDTAPSTVSVEVIGMAKTVVVYNIWDIGDGIIQSWHNGAAMAIEETENGTRYRCNDGEPDDDFDDLIFRIERITN